MLKILKSKSFIQQILIATLQKIPFKPLLHKLKPNIKK
ncbi:hypothetical protein SULYE_1136 [Sulfurihydrogenibium yellowstonense SS-5]|uniref:Uncharacterized protein n=1 Tax=Sulfurihydrogenibium yellowstonense SS-5 TaxID=432331 RepID=C4FKN6_9AQUI|nr:hypothetical protein SULYE_1136 [Sulfurihydrogenibium yellowstonense SS-5]